MAIDFKTFNIIINPILKAKFPVLIRGRHGIGKSELVYQTAKDLGLPIIERRASQMTEGDLLGLPKVEKGVTKWLAPEWLHRACNEPVVLFLDEVDRATMEVRQGIFELCDSRKIAGSTLHPDTIIFAAVNGGKHGAQYQVGEMDPAELDRYTVFDVEPSVEDWLDWAQGKVETYVWDFINNNHGHLEHKEEFEPNKKYASRRSWVRLDKTLKNVDVAKYPYLQSLVSGFVGMEAAVAFTDFIQCYKFQVSVEDLLDNGRHKLVAKFDNTQHLAMIQKMKEQKVFDTLMNDNRLKNLADYFVGLPSEIAMTIWTNIGQAKIAENITGFHGTITSDGQQVNLHIVKLMNGK